MNLLPRAASAATAGIIAASASALLVAVAPMAKASTVVAEDTSAAVIAEDTSPQAPRPASARMVRIDANLVDALSVTGHRGQQVTASAAHHRSRSVRVAANRPAVLTRLDPGVRYTISIGSTAVGSAIPVGQVSPATGLVVETTDAADTLRLTWKHVPTRAQGNAVRFDILATPTEPAGAVPVKATATTTTTTLAGIDPDRRYTFTVTPRNSASTGKSTQATMTRTINQVHGGSVPVALAPAPAAPQAPATPTTVTIYTCPDGFTEVSASTCRTTLAYTYDVKAYTYHQQPTGPAPRLDSYDTTAGACPTGYNLEDYGWITYCRRYGQAPTATVKDPTPSGYTDTGTTWSKKNDTPTGYTDDGSRWIREVAKITLVVPA